MKPITNITLYYALNMKPLTLRYVYYIHLMQKKTIKFLPSILSKIFMWVRYTAGANKNQFYPPDFDLCTINACTLIFISLSLSKYSH